MSRRLYDPMVLARTVLVDWNCGNKHSAAQTVYKKSNKDFHPLQLENQPIEYKTAVTYLSKRLPIDQWSTLSTMITNIALTQEVNSGR